MANIQQVRKGSTGSSVKKLQKLLNQNGYSLSEDGNFGNKTLEAVKDYQSKSGLSADGIVGEQTWGALTTKSTNTNGSNNTNKNAGFNYDSFTYDDYAESETVSQAFEALNSQLSAKPGDYQSTWQGKIDSMIDKILNREDFSYDVNSDALYQQYKDQYTQLGKLAMADTMGQAAAMTGGYGSSYATTSGNQAYQAYLSQLNEVIPELHGMALDRYNQEGQDLYNNYALLSDQEQQEYSRHQDEYNKWLAETQLANDRYDSERNFDYSQYVDDRNFNYGVYSDDRNLSYNEYRNSIADAQWQKQYDENVRQFDKQMALNQEKWDYEKQQLNNSAKSYSGTTEKGTAYNNGNLTNGQIKELQAALGVDADGYYGSESKKAAGGLTAEQAYVKYVSGGEIDNGENSNDSASSFKGTSYEEATSYMRKNGASDGIVTELMTKGEWSRRKASYKSTGTGSTEVRNYDSYAEYLADYVEYAVGNN